MNYVGSEYYDGKHTAGYGMDLNDGAGGKYIYLHFDREYDGTNWMAGIDDDVFLSDLSIPGVHDAACYQIGQFNDTYAQTQWHYIGSGDDYVGYWNGSDDQTTRGLLDRGVRYFDLRIKTPATYDTLILGHTVEDAKLRRDGLLFLDKTYDLTFIKVWNWIVTFLQEHPTETIIIYPADEDFTSNAAAKTAKRVYQFLKGKAEAPDSIIWSGDHVPTLGEVRGKIVVHSNLGGTNWENYRIEGTDKYWALRYGIYKATKADGKEIGLEQNVNERDFEIWGENHYASVTREEKLNYHVKPALRDADSLRNQLADRHKRLWAITYTSANNLFHGAWSPAGFRRIINPAIIEYMRTDDVRYTGVVEMDFAEDDIVNAVWQNNYHYPPRHASHTLTFAQKPEDPVKENEVFQGWYDAHTGKRFDFAKDRILEDTTLTARYVNYFDLDGVEKKPENVDLLYGGSNVKLYGGWTAITQDVNVTKSFVVKEDTNLILADGCTIDSEVSIEIYPNATLTIWGQRDGTGTLKVSGGTGYAGIGSYEDRSDGNLVINGGTVLATGGEGGMGIGDASYSYDHRRFGSITVNGGIVKANGGLGGENVRTTLSWNRNSDQIYANRFEGDITLDRVFDYKGSNEAATLPLKAGGTLVPHYHTMTEHPGTAPTLDEEGSETYYTCQACGNVYRDAEGKEKLNNYPVVIPALSHTWGNVTYTSAVQDGQMNVTAKRYCDRHDHSEEASCIAERSTVRASTCAVKGEYEYTANFSEDWAGTHIWREEAELSNDHTLQHITGSEPGFEEYYNCTVCDRLFDDENGTHEIAKAVLSGDTVYLRGNVVKADIHSYYNDSRVRHVVALEGTVLPEDCSNMFSFYFYGMTSDTYTIDLSKADTSKVRNMSGMFALCENLQSLDLSGFDTSRVTDMNNMFADCSGLTNVNLSSFDTSEVLNMSSMFSGCNALQTLDLGSFNTEKVTATKEMFLGCGNLRTIMASTLWNTDSVKKSNNMFYNCDLLVGGNGTKCIDYYDYKDITLARLDVDRWNIGYLTAVYAVTLPTGMTVTSVVPADKQVGNRYLKGAVVSFSADDGYTADTVKAGNMMLTPDENGIYSVTVDNYDIKITCAHLYEGEAVYNWLTDYEGMSASRICAICGTHTESVQSEKSVITEPSCTEGGQYRYTATFTDPAFTAQIATVDVDALGHAWNPAEYVWSEDHSTVTATHVCQNDPAHTETETVQTSAEEIIPPSCDNGTVRYTSNAFENPSFEVQTFDELTAPVQEHSWSSEIIQSHSVMGNIVVATCYRCCTRDSNHYQIVICEPEKVVIKEATYTKSGQVQYNAKFREYAESHPELVAEEGMDYSWAEDFSWTEDVPPLVPTVSLPREMVITNDAEINDDGTVKYGTVIDFTVKEGYTAQNVKANGSILTPENGIYTITATETITVSAFIKPVGWECFTGHSLSLNGDIGVNFYLDLTEDEIAEGVKVDFTWLGKTDQVTVTASDYVAKYGWYKATCYVSAPEMTDTITAVLSINDYAVETDTYCVKDYADVILSGSYRTEFLAKDGNTEEDYNELAALVTAMLNYGGSAQLQFVDQHPDNTKMANEGLTAPIALTNAELDAINMPKPDKDAINAALDGTGISYYGYTMLLHSKTTLRFYFEKESPETDITGITLAGHAAKNYNKKYAYVEVEGIPAYELNVTYDLVINNSTVGSYSALTYVKDVLTDETADAILVNTVTAMYRYHKAAVAYFPSNNG